MRKIFQIIMVIFIIAILTYCECDDEKYFRITAINNFVELYGIGSDGSIKRAYSLYITYEQEYYSHNIINNFNLINSAYATSPFDGDGYMGCKELVNKINVYCSHPYDSIHSANDTINSVFSFTSKGSKYNFGTDTVNLTEFKNYRFYWAYDGFILTMLKKPTIDTMQQFTIEFIMSDNEVFTTTTDMHKYY